MLRDADFRIVDVNPAYEAMSGYARDEVLGADRVTIEPAPSWPQRRALHARALAGEQMRFETRGGARTARASTSSCAACRSSTAASRTCCTSAATSPSASAPRSALRASEEQYRAIFNAAADALVLRDADFRIVDVNPAYEAMSGFTRDEVVGATR